MKKQRNTPQRQLILEVVLARHDHPSAEEIYLAVKAIQKTISRATVYRNLHLLSENGEILQVETSSADRFDYRLDFHYHLICDSCGEVCDVPLAYQVEMEEKVAQSTGYKIHHHHTIFEGICPRCQREGEAAKG